MKGGPKRFKYTIPALIFALIKLSQDISNDSYNSYENNEEEFKGEEEEEVAPANKVTQKKIF